MDASTLLVSAEKNLRDPIEIKVDIVHPAPADVSPAATVVRTLAQHGEAILSIHGYLQGVPINEKMNALRFKMGMAEEENVSLHGRIKTIEAIDTITRIQEKRARMELVQQLASVRESQRQDQENFRKIQEIMPTTRQGANVFMTLEAVQAMIDQTLLRNNTTDDGSQNSGTEGIVGLSQWVEKMESVFHISGCAVENQKLTDKYCPKGEIKKLEIELWNLKVKGNDVRGYTQRFQELALMCTKLISNETEKVDKYISGLPDNIHGNVMSARPKTLDDAIELANNLMDQKLRSYAER
nr:hypothetical protein [Tanacetum cinerariifolium]